MAATTIDHACLEERGMRMTFRFSRRTSLRGLRCEIQIQDSGGSTAKESLAVLITSAEGRLEAQKSTPSLHRLGDCMFLHFALSNFLEGCIHCAVSSKSGVNTGARAGPPCPSSSKFCDHRCLSIGSRAFPSEPTAVRSPTCL